ncbi:hypothetical protein CR513_62601, partial [Mucuna pruriens]
MAKGQVKFLLIVVDYFTKWIEFELLATITIPKVQQFVWAPPLGDNQQWHLVRKKLPARVLERHRHQP